MSVKISSAKLTESMDSDKFHDECAVIGVMGVPEAANFSYLGLYSMQHRGQEGAGIASCDNTSIYCHKDMGLVADVFPPDILNRLEGSSAIGHTRYATFGHKDWQNLQPLVANFSNNSFSVAHNGNLVNAEELRRELEVDGAIFSSTTDTEVILHLIARTDSEMPLAQRVIKALERVKGAFSLVVLSLEGLIAVRDPSGVRPLSLASIDNGYVVASETCAFDLIDAKFIRDIQPGELIEVNTEGKLSSFKLKTPASPAFCIFEYIYFARPDSTIDGKNVYEVRKNLGKKLAIENPVEADVVIPVPDSGGPAALGYAQESGIPLEFGLIRNHYVGRTFIEPSQSIRDFGVKIKLNPNAEVLKGKRIVVVDDSIVRGTTCRKIVGMLRSAGAKEVHFRISSPPTTGPCYYGIDTPSSSELIAAKNSVDEICKYINADSLQYLSIDGMYKAVKGDDSKFCDACFSGNYRLGLPKCNGSKPSPLQVVSVEDGGNGKKPSNPRGFQRIG